MGLLDQVRLTDGGRDLDNYLFPIARRLGPERVAAMFAAKQEDADLPPDTEAWLAPKDPYAPALLQIALAGSPIRWPPESVFGAGDREALAGRLRHGLSPVPR